MCVWVGVFVFLEVSLLMFMFLESCLYVFLVVFVARSEFKLWSWLG